MTLKTLLAAAAATALLTGAAQAQESMSNEPQPAEAKDSQTAMPSVDSSRPTGGKAGKTDMPNGTVSGEATSATSSATDTSATTEAPPTPDAMASEPAADTSMAAPAAGASTETSMGAGATTGMASDTSAAMTTTTASNGPVADTPENRAKYRPLSGAGRATSAKGN